MQITIERLNEQNVSDVNRCDGAFAIDSRLVLHVEDGEIRYTVVDVPPFTKRYDQDDVDYAAYVGDPDRAVYLAYAGGQIAGQIILRENWNRYAYVEDIAVDARFRRIGIGRRLVQRAKEWARSKGLAGIMLETQNNNVGACRFYESCGFRLRGLDTQLYKGISPDTDEIALYWYLVFAEGPA